MLKKHIHFILFLAGFLLVLNFSYCFALEVQNPQGKSGYPSFPFVPQITEQSTLPNYFVYYFGAAMYIAGVLALIMLAVAGIQLIASAGNPERISEAKKRATSAILGLVLLFASFIIINTINPKLTNLAPSEPLKQVGGVLLAGPGGTMPAPSQLADISSVIQKYTGILWPQTVKNSNGYDVPNCNPLTDYPYIIYFYKDKNFKNLLFFDRLKCNENVNVSVDFSGALSYIMQPETPGVYFYPQKGCTPTIGSNEYPPTPNTTSIPNLSTGHGLFSGSAILSVEIVNGKDPYYGPFFGAIFFNASNYYGSWGFPIPYVIATGPMPCVDAFVHIETPGSVVVPPIAQATGGGSVVIYYGLGKWDKDFNRLSAGRGVTLYSKPQFTGGEHYFGSSQIPSGFPSFTYALKEIDVRYVGTAVPEKEQAKCRFFHVPGTAVVGYDYYCLKSLKIDGNYLVLLSLYEIKDFTPLYGVITGSIPAIPFAGAYITSEVFPQSTSIEGPRDLNLEEITGGRARYIEIIPLAEPLQ